MGCLLSLEPPLLLVLHEALATGVSFGLHSFPVRPACFVPQHTAEATHTQQGSRACLSLTPEVKALCCQQCRPHAEHLLGAQGLAAQSPCKLGPTKPIFTPGETEAQRCEATCLSSCGLEIESV